MATFDYRRDLSARELVPAIGIGLGAAVVVTYFAQLLLRRQRLDRSKGRIVARPRG